MTFNRIKRREFLKAGTALVLFGLISTGLFGNHLWIKNSDSTIKNKIDNLRNGRKILHRIIAVGDPHWSQHITYADPRHGEHANNIHYKKRHEMMIAWLNEETDSKGTDFIVFNGDLIHDNREHLPLVKEQFYDKLKANYYVVHGNHDRSSEEYWKDLWGYGRNHSFAVGNYGIILLNSASETGRYECANHEWLDNQLNNYSNKAGVLVFCHIFQHGRDVPYGRDCPLVTDVMMASDNLKMAIYSHTHKLDAHYPIIEDGKRLNTFFTGHFSGWGLPYLGYRVIEIYDENKIGTYVYSLENETLINYNLVY